MNTTNDMVRTWAQIDLAALKHNLDYAKKLSNRPVICVIKADAYGHGAVECGRFLQANGAAMFAVACLGEAVTLRKNGIDLPILILGYTSKEYVEALNHYDLEQTVTDLSHAQELNDAAARAGIKVKVHIKLDTGMSRTGIFAQSNHDEAIAQASEIYAMSNLDAIGIYTHFAVADTPSEADYTRFQYDNYVKVVSALEAKGMTFMRRHVSNSAAIMDHPQVHFDYVREGIMLYGMYPDSMPRTNGPLLPVMTLKSRVAQVRSLPEGTTVSYGRTYSAQRDIKSAVITAGYADGYPRRLSNKTYVVINSKRYPQIGRICMDMFMADVTDGDVKRDDEVILLGPGGMSMEEAAQIVGTINYELTCLVTNRAVRVYTE